MDKILGPAVDKLVCALQPRAPACYISLLRGILCSFYASEPEPVWEKHPPQALNIFIFDITPYKQNSPVFLVLQ